MHSTGCEADQGVHQGGQDEARQHGGGAGHHGVRLFQGASSIALSEHDYVMADIKKEVTDWEEHGSQEARDEEDEDTEEEGEEEDIGDGYDEEEQEEGKERWFNLSQLAEVRNTPASSSASKNILLIKDTNDYEKLQWKTQLHTIDKTSPFYIEIQSQFNWQATKANNYKSSG